MQHISQHVLVAPCLQEHHQHKKLISLSFMANMMADQPDRPDRNACPGCCMKTVDHVQLACLTTCFERASIPLSVYSGSCHF